MDFKLIQGDLNSENFSFEILCPSEEIANAIPQKLKDAFRDVSFETNIFIIETPGEAEDTPPTPQA